MRILIGVFIVVMWWAINVHATAIQQPVQLPSVLKKTKALKMDSGQLLLRKFDEEGINTYRRQPEFVYDDVPKTMSLWDRFWRAFWNWVNEFFSGKPVGGLIKYVLIGLGIAVIVFIIVKIIGLDLKLFTSKSKKVEIPFKEGIENIHEIDFDEELENGLQNGNYRLVVRLLYLKTLKQLTDRSLIDWRPEKTNQAYILELANDRQKEEFRKLTNQFEYIWYGEFFIDKNVFDPIQQSFQQFNQQNL